MDKIELAKKIQTKQRSIAILKRDGWFSNVWEIRDLKKESSDLGIQLAQAVIKEPIIIGVDYATDYLEEVREQARQEQKEKYKELIMAVENKYPDESGHVTALRYIKERENMIGSAAKAIKEG